MTLLVFSGTFFGIVLGLLILVIFGVFEKKRPELLRVVEDMRAWEQ